MAKHPASARAMASSTSVLGRVEILALHLEATHGVEGLGRQAEMTHDRDLGVADGLHHRHPLAAALELDRLGPGSDQSGGVVHGVGRPGVVAHPGQVGHDHRAAGWLGPRPQV